MDLESVDEVLRTTRSVRRRLDFERPIPPEVLEECIELATALVPAGVERQYVFFKHTLEKAKYVIAIS